MFIPTNDLVAASAPLMLLAGLCAAERAWQLMEMMVLTMEVDTAEIAEHDSPGR